MLDELDAIECMLPMLSAESLHRVFLCPSLFCCQVLNLKVELLTQQIINSEWHSPSAYLHLLTTFIFWTLGDPCDCNSWSLGGSPFFTSKTFIKIQPWLELLIVAVGGGYAKIKILGLTCEWSNCNLVAAARNYSCDGYHQGWPKGQNLTYCIKVYGTTQNDGLL